MSLMHADFTAHDFAPHAHDAFVFAVTELGGAEITSRNKVESVCPSVLFVSNPDERQSARMGYSQRWRYRSFYLTRLAIETISRDLGVEALPYFTQNMFGDADLIRGFGRLHRTLEAGQDGFHVSEQMIETFGELFRRRGSGGGRVAAAPRDRVLVNKVLALMQAGHSENLQLADLAAAVDMTSFQLIGLFRRTVGLTPHANLIRIRLNIACRCLRRGYPLVQSALEAGFYDQSALSKHFRRWYGITPRQFAEAAGSRSRDPAFRPSAISANTTAPGTDRLNHPADGS